MSEWILNEMGNETFQLNRNAPWPALGQNCAGPVHRPRCRLTQMMRRESVASRVRSEIDFVTALKAQHFACVVRSSDLKAQCLDHLAGKSDLFRARSCKAARLWVLVVYSAGICCMSC